VCVGGGGWGVEREGNWPVGVRGKIGSTSGEPVPLTKLT
jgi:hypothetical protein